MGRDLEGEAEGELEGAGAAGAEETAGGADWGKETLVEAVGIGGGRRVGAHRDEGNVAAGIAGVGRSREC